MTRLWGMRGLTLGCVLFLSACSWVPTTLNAYKIDVPQGNVVTQEMVSKLRLGMSRSQVRFVLGTPLVTDMFHPNRWDYVYQYRQAGRLTEQRRVTLYFDGDVLQQIEPVFAQPLDSEGSAAS